MKIAIITYNLKWAGGGQRLLFDMVYDLTQKGHKVVTYVPSTEYDPSVYADLRRGAEIRTIPVTEGYMWTPPPAWALRRMWYKFRKELWLNRVAKLMVNSITDDYDVINLHDFAYKFAYYYRKLGKTTRIVWTNNDPPFWYLPHPESKIYDWGSWIWNKLKNYLEAPYFRKLDAVSVVDEFNRKWTADRGMKVWVVRPGTDVQKFFQPVKNDFSERAGRKQARLMSLGILNPMRRYENILEAVKMLRAEGYDVTAEIVSRDFWKKSDYRAKLEGLLKEWGLESFVKFHFEGATEEEMREIYSRSDIFILAIHLPPPRDGMCWQLTGVEAMASGLPLVISRKNDMTEVLEDGKSALFFAPLHPEEMADKVKFLIDQPDKYAEIAKNGQEVVMSQLKWDDYVNGMLALFQGVPK